MIVNDSNIKNKIKTNSKDKYKIKRAFLAFVCGGLIGLLGQIIYFLLNALFEVSEKNSTLLVSAFFIIIAFLLTCLGVFDKLTTICYCGIIIPITGFANSITASALEGKSEGMIFGIGSKMFSLIGSVCTYGIVSSIFLGLIYFVIRCFA